MGLIAARIFASFADGAGALSRLKTPQIPLKLDTDIAF